MNGIMVIDKPSGWTSHDVVGKLRSLLRERRIGHGGTLDPMATGVLPVFVGRATRAVKFCESADKDYVAGLRLGLVTDTQDITGAVLETRRAGVTEDRLREVLCGFTGEQQQIPPMYSAVKINGKKLYELARRGIEAERKPRTITIKKLELCGMKDGDFLLEVNCSKGTYIRTLCHDIGQKLGCGAVMSSLVRTRAGAFTLNDAVTLEEVETAAQNGVAEMLLRPVDSLFSSYPALTIAGENEKKCRNGNAFKKDTDFSGKCRVYSQSGEFLMLGNAENGVIRTVKSFFEV